MLAGSLSEAEIGSIWPHGIIKNMLPVEAPCTFLKNASRNTNPAAGAFLGVLWSRAGSEIAPQRGFERGSWGVLGGFLGGFLGGSWGSQVARGPFLGSSEVSGLPLAAPRNPQGAPGSLAKASQEPLGRLLGASQRLLGRLPNGSLHPTHCLALSKPVRRCPLGSWKASLLLAEDKKNKGRRNGRSPFES